MKIAMVKGLGLYFMKKNSWTQFFNHKVSKIDVKNTVPLRKCTHICTLMSHHNKYRIGIDV